MKILVIVDLQNDFIDGPLGNKDCINACENTIKLINEEKFDKVFFTLDTHQKDYLSTQEGKNLPIIHCVENTFGWQINDKLLNAVKNKYEEKDIEYFKKPTFGSTLLGERIKNLFKEDKDLSIYMVGVCTGICVISNALLIKSYEKEVPINVIKNCCACVSNTSHNVALEAMKLCQINII